MTDSIPDYLHAERIAARGDTPMTDVEKLDELQFLLSLGVQTRRAAEQLGTGRGILSYLAFANDRPELGRQIEEELYADIKQGRES